jgi:cyclase
MPLSFEEEPSIRLQNHIQRLILIEQYYFYCFAIAMKKKMFLGADNLLFENAKALRYNPTPAELILWSYLKQKPLGYKFRRQHPISIYIADFYCHSLRLIIEVDGGIHDEPDIRAKDMERQKNLEAEDIFFLRFTNEQVEKDVEYVIKTIEEYMSGRSRHNS